MARIRFLFRLSALLEIVTGLAAVVVPGLLTRLLFGEALGRMRSR